MKLCAKRVLPVSSPPIEWGVVEVEDKKIVSVRAREPGEKLEIWKDETILPGLVNAHTHLDLGPLTEAPSTRSFSDWLALVVRSRRLDTLELIEQRIKGSIAALLQTGTTTVGDISSSGASYALLSQSPIRSVVFFELLGLRKERAEGRLDDFTRWLKATEDLPNTKRGVSPHAPYSTRRELFLKASELALPVAIHLAESEQELEFLTARRGPLAKFLKDLGAWDISQEPTSINDALELFSARHRTLFVHANYLTADQLSMLGPNVTVVHCPRTHAFFGHRPFPLERLLASGVRVALATDSLSSNPDLDLLAELAVVREQFPAIAEETLLKMVTLWPAEGLGVESECGSLEVGKSADLLVLSEDSGRRVMFQGSWV